MSADISDSGAVQMLRQAGLRVTKQRRILIGILLDARDHPDAEQVLARAQAVDPSLSQATTYRTLNLFARKGLAQTHVFKGSTTRYEFSGSRPHGHMIDVETDEIAEFASLELEKLLREMSTERGLDIVSYRLEVYFRNRPLSHRAKRQP